MNDRELDALVVEHIFGWRWIEYQFGDMSRPLAALAPPKGEARAGWVSICESATRDDERFEDWDKISYFDINGEIQEGFPHYSTDIAAAWTVVEKLHRDGWNISVHAANGWGCTLYKVHVDLTDFSEVTWEESHGPINADTAPRAICLAALKAKGVEL